MRSQEELIQDIIRCLQELDAKDPASDKLDAYLYTPSSDLKFYLDKLKEYTESKKTTHKDKRNAGSLLEQIALSVFLGVVGITNVKSFQSPGPQYDLLVSGDSFHWSCVCKRLYLEKMPAGLLIESKARNQPVDDAQFSKMCSTIHLNLEPLVGMGIFFSLKGATGFPRKNKPRQRKIGDARFRQVLFYAKTGKAIVVLDKEDIFELGTNGSLIRLLRRKVSDISELSGLSVTSCSEFKEIDLPPHLSQVYKLISNQKIDS